LIDEGALAIKLCDPDGHRCAVCDQSEAFFAFPQAFLRKHAIGDVDVSADQSERPALNVTLDLGGDADPAHLAVVLPNDAVFGRVVVTGSFERR
jgi:hypothetical protein